MDPASDFKNNNLYGRKHPTINQVRIIDNQNNFPISWLNTQGYCEYSLYLENFQHIKVEDTKEMKKGTQIHNKLEEDFKETVWINREEELKSISE